MVAGKHSEGQLLIAGSLYLPGGDVAHAVGVKQQQHSPLGGLMRLSPLIESLVISGILCLRGNQDLQEIQLIHQILQELHLVVFEEPLPG
jgi:hypothetical protein